MICLFVNAFSNRLKSYLFRPVSAEHIYNMVCKQFKAPDKGKQAIWFHGTRATDPKSFCKEGILPKRKAKQRVENILLKLTIGLEKTGGNPFSNSFAAKQNITDEGPFAFLIKEMKAMLFLMR